MSSPALRTPDEAQFQCDDCARIWPVDVLYRDERGGVCSESALRCPDCGGECFLWQSDEDEEDSEDG